MKWREYPGYKPCGVEWIGDIPEHWGVVRFKYFMILQRGHDLPTDQFVEGPYPVCGSNGVIGYHNQFTTIGPSITVGRSGSVGEVNYFEENFWAHNTALYVKIFIRAVPKFAYYLLKTLDVKYLSEGTAVGTLNRNYIHDLPIPLPSPVEQTKIATHLDREMGRIDALAEKKQRQIDLLQEKRTALISHAVTKGLDSTVSLKDSGVEWLGQIPMHWEVKKVKLLAEILRGKFSHRPRNDPQLYDGPYPFIQTGDIVRANKYINDYQQTLNELGFAVSKEFPRGTLVMSIAANIGDLAILEFPACFPDSIVGFFPKAQVDLNYLYYNLESMKQELKITAPLNTQQNLNIERIGPLQTVSPPINEQRQIAVFLHQETAKIDALIAKIQESIDRLKEYRTALISAAVTGQIDVREEAA